MPSRNDASSRMRYLGQSSYIDCNPSTPEFLSLLLRMISPYNLKYLDNFSKDDSRITFVEETPSPLYPFVKVCLGFCFLFLALFCCKNRASKVAKAVLPGIRINRDPVPPKGITIPRNPNQIRVSYNGGTQQPWVFLLKMTILRCFGGTPFTETPK